MFKGWLWELVCSRCLVLTLEVWQLRTIFVFLIWYNHEGLQAASDCSVEMNKLYAFHNENTLRKGIQHWDFNCCTADKMYLVVLHVSHAKIITARRRKVQPVWQMFAASQCSTISPGTAWGNNQQQSPTWTSERGKSQMQILIATANLLPSDRPAELTDYANLTYIACSFCSGRRVTIRVKGTLIKMKNFEILPQAFIWSTNWQFFLE